MHNTMIVRVGLLLQYAIVLTIYDYAKHTTYNDMNTKLKLPPVQGRQKHLRSGATKIGRGIRWSKLLNLTPTQSAAR